MTGPLLAADLVTLEHRGWSLIAARDILALHSIRRRTLDSDSAERLREWSLQLRSAFEANCMIERCGVINSLLADATSRVYLTVHDELKPHLHFAADDDDLLARVRAVTAGGLAIFLVESGGSRLGICQRGGCGVAFVDTSRNGLRAYCSATCGNYDAVRRHRGGVPPA